MEQKGKKEVSLFSFAFCRYGGIFPTNSNSKNGDQAHDHPIHALNILEPSPAPS
jgi:hypothetical protein